ncbi:MAG: response regulator [Phaeodactylibacter sp.]|uniref:response regulator n=1 Tax=Phaeodactylibacter sp. TaxID=1940289 RepID=UPI0032EFD917
MKKVLLVEDTPSIRENVAEYLELSGHDVLIAENGQEGWELLQAEKPDLVICDVKMPKLSGFEIKERANQEDELKTTPFIFLSAAAQKADIAKGHSVGAVAYLTKPFDMNELLSWVEKV